MWNNTTFSSRRATKSIDSYYATDVCHDFHISGFFNLICVGNFPHFYFLSIWNYVFIVALRLMLVPMEMIYFLEMIWFLLLLQSAGATTTSQINFTTQRRHQARSIITNSSPTPPRPPCTSSHRAMSFISITRPTRQITSQPLQLRRWRRRRPHPMGTCKAILWTPATWASSKGAALSSFGNFSSRSSTSRVQSMILNGKRVAWLK